MSSHHSKRRWVVAVVFITSIGLVFHFIQNEGALPGGQVAPVKSAWLFSVLFFWYVMPGMWVVDVSLPRRARIVFAVCLANMILRALIELPLMYFSDGWLHAYGIGHDLLSICLCVCLLWYSRSVVKHLPSWVELYLMLSATLFVIEAFFATYLRSVSNADGTVFFVPAEQSHATILVVTVIAVLLVWFGSYWIVKRSHE